jgi:hypothetical protein
MPSPPPATQQRNNFSEGFALGLILNGRWGFAYDKVAVDLAVTGAVRSWSYATAFPQVLTDLRGLDGIHALTRADERKRTSVLYWDTAGPELLIVSRDPDWSEDLPDDVAYAVEAVSDNVPREGWAALGADFLARFDR